MKPCDCLKNPLTKIDTYLKSPETPSCSKTALLMLFYNISCLFFFTTTISLFTCAFAITSNFVFFSQNISLISKIFSLSIFILLGTFVGILIPTSLLTILSLKCKNNKTDKNENENKCSPLLNFLKTLLITAIAFFFVGVFACISALLGRLIFYKNTSPLISKISSISIPIILSNTFSLHSIATISAAFKANRYITSEKRKDEKEIKKIINKELQ